MQKTTQGTAGVQGTQELVREQAKWEAVLEAEGLGVIGPETMEFDVSPDPELIRVESATAVATSVRIPTAGDRRVMDLIRQAGYAATSAEVGTTMGAVARLADAGLVNIRTSSGYGGYRVLALAGATDGDVERAAARQAVSVEDERIARTILERQKLQDEMIAATKKLGARDTKGLVAKFLPGRTRAAVEEALAGIVGLSRKASDAFDFITTAADRQTLVGAAERLQDARGQSRRNRAVARKTFAREASGDRPTDNANPTRNEAARIQAGREFRAAHEAAKQSGSHKQPETPLALARQLVQRITEGPNTFRGLCSADPKRGAAVLSRLVEKGVVTEIEFRGELGYTLGPLARAETRVSYITRPQPKLAGLEGVVAA